MRSSELSLNISQPIHMGLALSGLLKGYTLGENSDLISSGVRITDAIFSMCTFSFHDASNVFKLR